MEFPGQSLCFALPLRSTVPHLARRMQEAREGREVHFRPHAWVHTMLSGHGKPAIGCVALSSTVVET